MLVAVSCRRDRQQPTQPPPLHESLGQPPLHPALWRVLVGVARLLGDDMDRRWAVCEAIADLLDQYGGQRPE